MFKFGKKKGIEPAAPEDTKAEQTPAKAVAKGGSLLQGLLPAIAGSSLIVVAIGAVLYSQVIASAGTRLTSQTIANDSKITQHAVTQQLDVLQQNIELIARDPHLLRSVISGPDQLPGVADDYRKALAGATSVRILLPRQARKDDSSEPPISFAQLEMIKAAETGKAPPAEIHRANDKLYVSLTTPIKKGDEVVATLYTAFDFKQVQTRIGPLQASIGYAEWLQAFPGSPPLVVAALGNESNKVGEPVKLEWGVPHWTLHVYPLAQDNPLTSLTTLLLVIIGIGATLTAALGGLSLMLVQRQLQANAMALAGHFQALVSRDKHAARYTLPLFASLAQSIDRMFHEHDAQLRQQINIAKQDKSATAARSKSSLLDDEDPLDISLHGDDNDLLGGSIAERYAKEDLLASVPTDNDALDLDDIDIAERDVALPTEGLSPEIFRAYDIRGVVGKDLSPAVARLIGCAVGTQAMEIGQRATIVARDGRLSSESLQQALIEGLIESGQRVIDIGMVPTPVLYFATHTLDAQSGVMVTGSHNPPDYNGFKIVLGGVTLSNQQIQALRTRIEQGRFSRGQGTYERQEILKDYKDRITNDVVLAKPMRIVVDCGNGVGGVIVPEVLDRLGCSVTTLYGEVDGRFPNHHPDPSIAENLKDLIETVRNKNADLGIAVDGDGDRIGVVTKQGQIIWPDRLLMLYVRDLLSRNPGADVVYDVKCTRDIIDLVSSLGGRAILSPTGHSLMKAKMRETGALVGGELSGHIFFNDRWYGFDDATYAAARLLEILSMEPFDIDEVFAEFPSRVNTPEIKIPLSEARKFSVVEKLADQGNFSGGNLVKIDGVRVDYPDGWGLIRASNTTPNLIARFEGDDDDALQRVMQRFREQLHNVEPGLSIPF